MKIEILGISFIECIALETVVKEAIAESGKFIEYERIDDLIQRLSYKIISIPGLIIDGEMASSGKLLSLNEVPEPIKS